MSPERKPSPGGGFPPSIVTPGVRSSLDVSSDPPASANSDIDNSADSSTEEVRTLLGSRKSDGIIKSRKRLLWGFYAYSIASEVRSVTPHSARVQHNSQLHKC